MEKWQTNHPLAVTDEGLRATAKNAIATTPSGRSGEREFGGGESKGGGAGSSWADPPPKFGWTPPEDPNAVVTRHSVSPQKSETKSETDSETDSAIEAFLRKFYGKDGPSAPVDLPPSTPEEYQTAVENSLANNLEHRYKNLSEEEGLEGDALEKGAYDASADDFDSMRDEQARWDDYGGSGYTLFQMEDSKGESRMFIDTPNGLLSTDIVPPIDDLVPEISEPSWVAGRPTYGGHLLSPDVNVVSDMINEMLRNRSRRGE